MRFIDKSIYLVVIAIVFGTLASWVADWPLTLCPMGKKHYHPDIISDELLNHCKECDKCRRYVFSDEADYKDCLNSQKELYEYLDKPIPDK